MLRATDAVGEVEVQSIVNSQRAVLWAGIVTISIASLGIAGHRKRRSSGIFALYVSVVNAVMAVALWVVPEMI